MHSLSHTYYNIDYVINQTILELCIKACLNVCSRKAARNQLLTDGIIPIIVAAINREVLKDNKKSILLYSQVNGLIYQ